MPWSIDNFPPTLHNRPYLTSTLIFSLGAATGISLLLTSLAVRRRLATEDLKASVSNLSAIHTPTPLTEYGGASHASITRKDDTRAATIAARARKGDYDEELILEQLARNRVFLTDAGLAKLRDAFVVVVGLGGVGSHATAALARSGVSRLRIVDFDQVTLSSLNRHAVATLADVGTPKVHAMRRRLEQIAPWCRIDCRNELFGETSKEKLLAEWDYELLDGGESKAPDWVVDCIDNIDTKVALLKYCHGKDIRVVSAMGAGCKSDPTRICVGDISSSVEDPLAKATRRRLRILGIERGIPVVFSTEKPGPGKAELLPIADAEVEKGEVGKLGVLPDFRVRILPVLGTMPAVFGYTLANYIICEIAGYPIDYRVGDRGREKMYDAMLASLQGMETRLLRDLSPKPQEDPTVVGVRIPISTSDVAYLVEEVFRGKSVVSGLTNRLALVRWRRPANGFAMVSTDAQNSVKLALGELVLMTKEEAQRHVREVLQNNHGAPEDVYGPDVLSTVHRRLEEEKAFDKYR